MAAVLQVIKRAWKFQPRFHTVTVREHQAEENTGSSVTVRSPYAEGAHRSMVS
jgi:hypothetical protein